MADVFLALSTGPFGAKKLVVLKCPRAFDQEYAGMFMDEARLAMRLNHPNVVQTYDVGVHDGSFFLAMEFLEGQPLHRLLVAMAREGRYLSHGHLARIVSDALAGLHYAHELCDYDGTPLQIVHRDVSPHNLFVTYDGHVKVVDFGIAKATLNVVSTAAGSVKGKLAYMAPEHAMSGIVDRRADLFAMGIVLWEMIARRRLITGVQSSERLNRLLTMEFPPLSAEVANVHPLLEVVAMRALQRDPRERYQTAAEMRDALEAYIGACGEPVRSTEIAATTAALFADIRVEMSARIRTYVRSTMPQPTADDATDASLAPEVETARIPMAGVPATPAAFGPRAPSGPPPMLGPPGVFGPPGALALPMRSSPPPGPPGEPGTWPTGTAVVTWPAITSHAPRPARFGLVVLVALLASVATLGLTFVFLAIGRRAPPAAAVPPAPTATAAEAADGGEAAARAPAPSTAVDAGSAGAKAAGPSTHTPGSRGPSRGKPSR
jgi:serine/threonine protein kinase